MTDNYEGWLRSDQCDQPTQGPLQWESDVLAREIRYPEKVVVSIEGVGLNETFVESDYWFTTDNIA